MADTEQTVLATLSEEQKREIKTVSDTESRILGAIEDLAVPFGNREKIKQNFNTFLRKHPEGTEQLPDEWMEYAGSQYVLGRIFANPALLRKFGRSVTDELTGEMSAFLRRYRLNPWRYVLFTVQTVDDSDIPLLQAEDALSGEPFLIYSAPLANSVKRSRKRLYFCLLFSNGLCRQMCGIVTYFQGISVQDLEFYAQAVEPSTYRNQGLDGVIQKEPHYFSILISYAELPVSVFRGEPAIQCASVVSSEDLESAGFSPDNNRDLGTPQQKAYVYKWELATTPDAPIANSVLYHDTKKRVAILYGFNERLYAEGRDLLLRRIPDLPFPAVPEVSAGMTISVAARRLFGKTFPGTEYDELFAEDD